MIKTRGIPPSARYGHSACIHMCRGVPRMIIFGGYRKIRLNDMFEYDTDTQKWREIKLKGIYPGPRDCHSAILYKGRYMIVFGGANGVMWLNDVYQFDIITEEWTLLPTNGREIPQGRAGHAAVLLNDDMIITAGWMGSRTLNDCWKYNLKTYTWTEIKYASNAPRPRDSHTSIIHFDKNKRPLLYIIGGGSSSKRHTGICVFDFETRIWSTLKSQSFLRLAGHDVIKTPDDKCLFFGGGDGISWKRTLVQYDLRSDIWYKIKSTNNSEPPGAYGLSFVLYQSKNQLKGLCWGGGNGDNFYQDLYELDLSHRYTIPIIRDKFLDCIVKLQVDDSMEIDIEEEFVVSQPSTITQSSSSAPISDGIQKKSSMIRLH